MGPVFFMEKSSKLNKVKYVIDGSLEGWHSQQLNQLLFAGQLMVIKFKS